jgi:hypothetical protein
MSEKDEIKQQAAMILLRSGLANVSEAAELRGVSRQAMHKAALVAKLDARGKRQRYLKTVWKDLVNRLTG